MKRVLVIVYTPTYGGPHNQIVQLYEPLLATGWETVALLPEADEDSYKKFIDKGIKVVTKPMKRLRAKNIFKNNLEYFSSFVKNVRDIKDIIVEESIDVVQVCGLMHIHAAFACKELEIPLVWQFLGTFAPLPLRILYTPLATVYSDWIMTTGMRTAKQHVFHYFFKKKHSIFYPPVDTEKFSYSSEKRKHARNWMGIPEDAFLVGTVGNQNKTKGHDYFIDIAEKLFADEDIYCRIIGKFTPSHAEYYEQEVIEKAREKSLLQDRRLDIKEDDLSIDTIMSGFDVFLLTSRIEGLPTVVLEAMSTGLPIVTNNVGSIEEVINHGRQGYIYSDLNSAVNSILKLKKNNKLRKKIGRRNRIEAQEKYDKEVCARKHSFVYDNVLK